MGFSSRRTEQNGLPTSFTGEYNKNTGMNPDAVLGILAHPTPHSFTAALLDAALEAVRSAEGESAASITVHDLYAEAFPAVLSAEELRRNFPFDELTQAHVVALKAARFIVIAHPDWWGGPPAILKGWVERVFRAEVAYEVDREKSIARGLLGGRSLLVLVPTETSAAGLVHFWTESVASYAGMDSCVVEVFSGMRSSTMRTRKKYLERAGNIAEAMFLGRQT